MYYDKYVYKYILKVYLCVKTHIHHLHIHTYSVYVYMCMCVYTYIYFLFFYKVAVCSYHGIYLTKSWLNRW